MKADTVYFPNLNSLRFIAASMVFLGHTEKVKAYHNLKCYFHVYPIIFNGGHLAVIFFFVLSGFLITHIIYRQIQNNQFSVTDFYKKRVIRIWPLYYLIVITGIYVLPQIPIMVHNTQLIGKITDFKGADLLSYKLLCFLVLPSLASFYGAIQYLAHLWSIGTEEQFYLIWPLLMKLFPNHVMKLLVAVIVTMWALRGITAYFEKDYLFEFLNLFRIDSMAIGGIGAAVLIRYPAIKNILLNRAVEIAAIAVFLCLYCLQVDLGMVSDEIYSIFFALIIWNAAANPGTIIRLEKIKPLNYFGTISYGIYMYHAITGALALIIFQRIHPSYMSTLFSNVVFYIFAFALTIGVASLSYELVEKRIINWGRKKWLTYSE